MGQGAYGTVVKAINKKTQEKVAIKLMNDIQKDSYRLRQILRELIILRKLSEIKNNIFTTKLIDVIIPLASMTTKGKSEEPVQYDLTKITHIFIIMEL